MEEAEGIRNIPLLPIVLNASNRNYALISHSMIAINPEITRVRGRSTAIQQSIGSESTSSSGGDARQTPTTTTRNVDNKLGVSNVVDSIQVSIQSHTLTSNDHLQ